MGRRRAGSAPIFAHLHLQDLGQRLGLIYDVVSIAFFSHVTFATLFPMYPPLPDRILFSFHPHHVSNTDGRSYGGLQDWY